MTSATADHRAVVLNCTSQRLVNESAVLSITAHPKKRLCDPDPLAGSF
jgi:hypothetical protein